MRAIYICTFKIYSSWESSCQIARSKKLQKFPGQSSSWEVLYREMALSFGCYELKNVHGTALYIILVGTRSMWKGVKYCSSCTLLHDKWTCSWLLCYCKLWSLCSGTWDCWIVVKEFVFEFLVCLWWIIGVYRSNLAHLFSKLVLLVQVSNISLSFLFSCSWAGCTSLYFFSF